MGICEEIADVFILFNLGLVVYSSSVQYCIWCDIMVKQPATIDMNCAAVAVVVLVILSNYRWLLLRRERGTKSSEKGGFTASVLC